MSDINIQTFSGKVQVNNNLKVGQGHLFVDTANNQVGLNTTNPLANLHVNGNTYVHSDLRVGSGIVMDQKVATFGTTKTFVVEVVGGVFQIDGVSRPALTFHESQTYILDQSHVSNSGHPIAFAEAVNGGTPYATGVTSVGTPGQAGAKTTFKVHVGAPSNLFYYCVNHPTTMGSLVGTPSVVSTEAEIIVSGRLLATSIHGDGSALVNIPSSAINGTLSQWTDVNTNEIYYDLGNVGIGNQNPNSTLDVTGTGSFSGDLTVGTNKFFVNVSTGQVGVGTTNPAAGKALDVIGDLRATYLYGDGSNINNITSSQWVTTGSDIYYDTGSVRVGSTQAPTETLDVTGTSAFSDDLTVGTSKLVVDVSESRVGVNKAAPGYTLDVLGDINFTGDIRKGGVVQTFGGGAGGGGTWTEISGTSQIHYSAGNVGISNNNPQHTLSVGDNLYVEDAGSNVLVIDGNVACNQVTLGQFEIVPSYGLDDVTAESNVTTDTVELNNVTTGLSTVSNVVVGGELTVGEMLNLPQLTSDPSPGVTGGVYFNTTSSVIRYYNGSVWGNVSNAPPGPTGGTVVIPSHSLGSSLTYDLGIDFEDDQDSDTQLTYTLASGTLPTGSSLPSAGASTMSGTLTTEGTFNFTVQASDTGLHTSIQIYQIVVTSPVGQQTFTTTGTTTWIAPSGVTSVSVVCVGGGGGGAGWYGSGGAGGGLAWRNNVSVTPGTSYTVTVGAGGTGHPTGQAGIPGSVTAGNGGTSSFLTTVAGGGQHGGQYSQPNVQPSGGTFTGDGGGVGGTCEGNYSSGPAITSGGGGAGGYTGTGGKGAGSAANNGTLISATAGAGGGGGGGGARTTLSLTTDHGPVAGGGVGLDGQGANGAAGVNDSSTGSSSQVSVNVAGGGGSGGARGGLGMTTYGVGGVGGLYGGGGGPASGDSSPNSVGGSGGNGGVRIIWGTGRSFPTNAA